MGRRIHFGVSLALLVLALVLPTLLGLVTPFIIIAIAIGVFIATVARRQLRAAYADMASRGFLLAFLVTLVEYALTAQAPGDVRFAFNFTMLVLYGPIALFLGADRDRLGPQRVALLALAGVVVTLAMAGWFQLHAQGESDRLRAFNLGPIVEANATLGLAVLASMGALVFRSRWSLLLPLTIVGGVAVALMGGSRGPLLGIIPLVLLTLGFIWVQRREARWLIGLGTLGAAAAGVAAVLALGTERVVRLPQILGNLFAGDASGDQTTEIRLSLYRAGWRAFLDAPWLGHGWVRLMKSAAPYQDPALHEFVKGLPQLHNDVLNFAVSGGVVGVGVYLIIIVSPLIAAWRSPRDNYWAARLYGVFGLAIVYVSAGLTDLMFGHEYHTAMYVMLNAAVLGLCRAPKPNPEPQATSA